MRAAAVETILALTLAFQLAAQPVDARAPRQFVLSSYRVHDDRYSVNLVTIHNDGTVVIVQPASVFLHARPGERFILLQARPGERFCVASGERCTKFRRVSVDVRHQRALIEVDEHYHPTK
jgi:hypothetical protein